MALELGQIAATRQRVTQANERRVAAETRLEANREEEQRILAMLNEKYGLDGLPALSAFLEAEEAAIAAADAFLNAALDEAAKAAAAVPDA